jgi:hypothetical protein
VLDARSLISASDLQSPHPFGASRTLVLEKSAGAREKTADAFAQSGFSLFESWVCFKWNGLC